MYKFLTLMFALIFSQSFVLSQQNLEVDYTTEFEMSVEQVMKRVPKRWRAQAEAAVRQELANGPITFQFKLFTNGKESKYTPLPQLDNTQGPSYIKQRMSSWAAKGDLYKDLVNKITKKEQDLFDDAYIIVDSARDYQWKISREKLSIAGYECKKATGVYDDSTTVVAYYSPKIPIKDGPDVIQGLPGLVLQAEFTREGTKQRIYAKNIAVLEEEPKIGKPRKGKEISTEGFFEKLAEIRKKFRETYGSGVDTDD